MRLLLNIDCDGADYCLMMYNMSTLQNVSMCFITCFMFHASRITNGVGGSGHFYPYFSKVCSTTWLLFGGQRYWESEFDSDSFSRTALFSPFFTCFLAFAHPILDGLVRAGFQSDISYLTYNVFQTAIECAR